MKRILAMSNCKNECDILLRLPEAGLKRNARRGEENGEEEGLLSKLMEQISAQISTLDLQDAKISIELKGQLKAGSKAGTKLWVLDLGVNAEMSTTTTVRVEATIKPK